MYPQEKVRNITQDMTNHKQKSEFTLIDWIKKHTPPAGNDISVSVGDDMAVMRLADERNSNNISDAIGDDILITTDTLMEDVHFDLSRATLKQVGYKAMACSLSDCAAMAAIPWVAVVAVSLNNNMTMDNAKQLHNGLQEAAYSFNCPIVGGDTTSWDKPLVITVTMLARSAGIDPVLRNGAKVGDAIMVTGQLGGSYTSNRHLQFTPRISEARQLAQLVNLHAMMDISDGIAGDLPHICKASNVSAIIYADKIPISPEARKSNNPIRAALTDGEDFELLFCISNADTTKLQQLWTQHNNNHNANNHNPPVTQIGKIIKTPDYDTNTNTEANLNDKNQHSMAQILIKHLNGMVEPLLYGGWQHWETNEIGNNK